MKQQNEKMESIKTIEDACNVTGMAATPEFNELPEELREFMKALYEAVLITKAIVGDWKADWSNSNQKKWFAWFRMSPGGFVFGDALYGRSFADAGNASRLCFPTEEMAEYAGRTFTDVYSKIIIK